MADLSLPFFATRSETGMKINRRTHEANYRKLKEVEAGLGAPCEKTSSTEVVLDVSPAKRKKSAGAQTPPSRSDQDLALSYRAPCTCEK